MNPSVVSQSLATRWFYWWADRPSVQMLVLIALTGLSIVGYVSPSTIRNLFVENVEQTSPSQQKPKRRPPPRELTPGEKNVTPFQVGGGECVLIAEVSEGDFFTPLALASIRRAVERVQSLPQVADLLWLDNVPGLNLFGLSGTLLPSERASQRQLDTARSRVLENPLAVGQLISQDGRLLVMHLRLDWFFVTHDDAATLDIRSCAEQASGEVSGVKIRYWLTGPVPLHLMTVQNHVVDSAKYQMIGYSIMLLSALVMFRGLSAVTIVAIAPAFGVFWTMGMLHFFNLQDNPFNDIIVPVLISLVGLTDAVHMMVEIRYQRASGLGVRDATRHGTARVGLACVLTSLTTAIGFVSLAWAHHEIVRQFGWCCVLGVTLTLISVLTVVPLGCRSPLGHRLHVGLGRSLVDGQLRRIEPWVDWVLHHHRGVAWFAIVITVFFSVMALQLEPDERRYSGLSESGEAAIGLRRLDEALGGLEFGFVAIDWDTDVGDGELLTVLNEIATLLSNEPLIGHPLGLQELLASLPGEGDATDRMSLLELLPPSLKRAFYAPEAKYASIQFRIQDRGIAAYGPTFTRIESGLSQIAQKYSNYRLSLEGDAPFRWRNVYRIVIDLAASLGSAALVIWIVLTIAYRSIRIGLISIVPNLFPLATTALALVVWGQNLEIVTVCVFTICLGIAVDDTIHFLTRYQEVLREYPEEDHVSAIRRAFTGVGTALLMTTIVLIAGMLSAVVGDARDARLFGIMGSLTLATALIGDVLLLPALLCQFDRPRVKS